MMALMVEVWLFGTPEVRRDGAPVAVVSTRAQSLLAYLVLQADRPQRRDHLAFLLWPESTEKQARTNLRHVLHTLRTTIPDADRFLHATPRTLSWHGSWSDVAAFEAALNEAALNEAALNEAALNEAALNEADDNGGDGDRDERVRRLREAVDLYRGDLLDGWYDDWVVPERDRLRRQALAALDQLVPALEALGDRDAAIGYAERALTLDPLAEATYRTLMRLHDARGDRGRALRVYHECTAKLRDELGVEPSAQTRAGYEALLPGEPHDAAPPAGAAPLVREAPLVGVASLVGRPAERRMLTDLWQDSRRGRAQLVVVSGEPGIGKTRLVDEVRLWAARRGAVTATARSYAVEGTLAYAPIVAWLRAPDIARRRGHLDRRQLDLVARLLPELSRDDGPGAPDEPEYRVQLFEAAARALLAGPGPWLLVADDLHAADLQTVQFLHYLLRAEPDAPVLVAATARLAETDPDDPVRGLLSGLRALDRCTRIDLARLDRAETGLLAGRLAGHRLSDVQVDRLYTETAGNPLFVVETVRAGWPSRGDPDALTPKVQAVLEARLDQLTAGARALLGMAATVGAAMDVDLLARLHPAGEDGLTRDLDELWRRQLLVATGVDRYDFSHDKLRELAYRVLGPAQRRHNHRVVAAALRDGNADHPDPVAGRIAAHLAAAGAHAEAVDWYARAAAAAQRVYADVDAARLLARALDLLRTTPHTRERDRSELALLTSLVGPLASAEGYASTRLATALDQALELAGQLGVEPAAPLLRAQGMAVLSRGDVEAAIEAGARLRARDETDDVLVVEGEFVQGMAAYWCGDLARARDHLDAALARYRPENRPAHLRLFGQDPQPLCVARLAHVHLFLGDPAEARRLQGRSLDLARDIRHPFTLGAALLFAGLLDVELLDVDPSDLAALRRHVAELDALREQVPAAPIRLVTDALAGYLDVADGRIGAGTARIDAALADPERYTAPGIPGMLLRIRLAACERSGDAELAVETAERLLADYVSVWDDRARETLER
jgi:DNA-binding SARP family transcriptional activator